MTTSEAGESKILKLFENPLFNSQALSDFLRKLFGSSRSPGDDAAGAEMQVRSVRRTHAGGPNARPLPTRIRFTDDGKPGAALGVGGALLPGVGRHQQLLQAGLVPGHRLPADRRRRCRRRRPCRTTTCFGGACLGSVWAPRSCAVVPTATSSTSRRSSTCSSICAPATRHPNTSTSNAANLPAISACSSCSTPRGRPPKPMRGPRCPRPPATGGRNPRGHARRTR